MSAHSQAILLTSTIWNVYFSHENSCMNNHQNLPFSAAFDPTATGRAMQRNHTNGVHTCPSTSKFRPKKPHAFTWLMSQIWRVSFCFYCLERYLDFFRGVFFCAADLKLTKLLKANTNKLADSAEWMGCVLITTVYQCAIVSVRLRVHSGQRMLLYAQST